MHCLVKKTHLGFLMALVINFKAFAQIKEFNYKYNPSCNQAIQLNPEGFYTNFERQNTVTLSDVEIDQLYMYWADCKYKENQANLSQHKAFKVKLMKVQKQLDNLFNKDIALTSQLAGETVNYEHARSRYPVRIAEFISELIEIGQSTSKMAISGEIEKDYQRSLYTIEVRLEKIKNLTTKKLRSTDKKVCFDTVKAYEKAIDDIKKVIGRKIDYIGVRILEFVAGPAWIDDWLY